MRTIVVNIEYATISPSVLENLVFNDLCGFYRSRDIDEDYFEFTVKCSNEDAAWVEKRLALYV